MFGRNPTSGCHIGPDRREGYRGNQGRCVARSIRVVVGCRACRQCHLPGRRRTLKFRRSTADLAERSRSSRLLRVIVALRWPAIVIGLLVVGASLTYVFAPPTGSPDSIVEFDPSDLVAAQSGSTQPMPSVLGLDRDVALTVLSDAGLGSVATTFAEKPAAGPVGLILTQSPSAAAASVDEIELTVSIPATVPSTLIGSDERTARTALEQSGAVVQLVRAVDASVPRGQVLAVDPPAGAVMPTVVTVTVADPGDALSLASVSTVMSSSFSTVSSVNVNGGALGSSVELSPSARSSAYGEYSLSRGAVALEAIAGTDDREGTGSGTITVFGDGRELTSVQVGLGQSTPIRVDLNGVMRLRIEATTTNAKDNPTVILGDAKLLGSTEGLNLIAGTR
ncbi:hypothetical protein AYK61_21715 [Rhodococcus sp. SBT000017]|nr:hypothetical protein AYK61_21715 [Rhodococcus sp. SBT000017]